MAVESPEVPGETPEAIPPPSQPPSFFVPEAAPAGGAPPAIAPPPLRRRGGRSLLWYAALLVVVVVTLGGFGLLFVDDQSWQRQAGQLQRENASLHEQLLTSQTSEADYQQQVKDLKAQLQHPSLGIWNVPQKIDGPDWYLAGGIPDTFTYHLNATSTGPFSVSILTFEQFAAARACLDAGRGNANYCMHHSGTVKSWLDVRSVSYDFHLSEGCAGYMDVFTAASAVTVMPDVSVTYNPAPTFTGEC